MKHYGKISQTLCLGWKKTQHYEARHPSILPAGFHIWGSLKMKNFTFDAERSTVIAGGSE